MLHRRTRRSSVVLITDYDEIRRRHGADDEPPRLILHRRNLIVALCVSSSMHPRVYASPAEVWIEATEHMEEWAQRLAWDTGAVHLYVSPEPSRGFVEMGIYNVIGSTDDRLELARRMAFPGIDKLSRVVFLSGPHSVQLEDAEAETQQDGFAE